MHYLSENPASRLACFFAFLFLLPAYAVAGELKTYPAPEGAPLGTHFTVRVRQAEGEWQEVATYQWCVDNVRDGGHHVEQSSVAYFDMDGEVEVEVTSLENDISSARIRPLSYDIPANMISARTLRFTLDRPRLISVEINGDIYHNLQLFANPIEEETPEGNGVRVIKPGYYDLADDSIHVGSGETLVVSGGAYVKGWISTYGSDNVKIVGHGIVNPERQHEGIMVRYSRNVLVSGPITTQVPVGESENVEISNVKCITWYGWGDGMNVFASSHVKYNHVFCRTSDDCSTIYCTRKGYHGSCHDISVSDAVYWADVAHPIMIGLHGDVERQETISGVSYSDIDILEHSENQIDYMGCIGINNGDNILVSDITFNDIRIEEIRRGMLLNFRVCYNRKYCAASGRGIENITLRNISYNGKEPVMSIIAGYDDSRCVRDISFENLSINGRIISDDMPGKLRWYKTADYAGIFLGEHVEDVRFVKTE